MACTTNPARALASDAGSAAYCSTLKCAARWPLAAGCVPESALTPVDISVDNGGEARAVPVDALGDTAAGAVASYFQGVT